METQFSIKDFLNYVISGFLWMVVIFIALLKMKIINNCEVSFIKGSLNMDVFAFFIIIFISYLFGNLFRFTDVLIIAFNKYLYGDPYKTSLKVDKNQLKDKDLGLIGRFSKSKNLSIGLKKSEEIYLQLKSLNLINENKKTQFEWVERYLLIKSNINSIERLKNLKNFYDSITIPIFILMINLNVEIFSSDLSLTNKAIVFSIIMLAICGIIKRYNFLYSNYIKEVYRIFYFSCK